MGIDRNTFVGPYVLVKPKEVQVEKTRTVYVSASGRKHPNKINFDPVDGSAVEAKKESYFDIIKLEAWYQIIDHFLDKDENLKNLDQDLFYNPDYLPHKEGYKVWLANKRVSGKSMEEVEILNLTGVDTMEEIKKFKEVYNDVLLRIRDYVEDIKICYGVVNYHS